MWKDLLETHQRYSSKKLSSRWTDFNVVLQVTASGPGLEPEGVIINRPTYFDIFAKGAGKGSPEVIILDPKGKKDSVPNRITPHETEPDTYKCEYVATMVGLHSVNVFFAGNPIPHSPYGVRVSPASIPSKVWASGKKMF